MKKTFIIIILLFICLNVISCSDTKNNEPEENSELPGETNTQDNPQEKIELFDGFNKTLYAMPKVLRFGDAIIEAAVTYETDGENIFQMTLYLQKNEQPIMDFEEYKNLEIVFSDGMSISPGTMWLAEIDENGGYAGMNPTGNFICSFQYKNFPREREFTLKSADDKINTEIELKPIKENLNIKVSDYGGKRVAIIPAAEGSKFFVYHIEVLKPSLTEIEAKNISYSIPPTFEHNPVVNNYIMFEDREKLPWPNYTLNFCGGFPIFDIADGADKYTILGIPQYREHFMSEHCFSGDFSDEEIYKTVVNELRVTLGFIDVLRDSNGLPISDINFNDVVSGEYTFDEYNNSFKREFTETAKAYIPVPKDGEIIDYEENPLKIAEIGEFAMSIVAAQRHENYLIVYFGKDHITYSGDEDVSLINMGFYGNNDIAAEDWQIISKVTDRSYKYDGTLSYSAYIIPENFTGDMLEKYIESIWYNIQGEWVTEFIK